MVYPFEEDCGPRPFLLSVRTLRDKREHHRITRSTALYYPISQDSLSGRACLVRNTQASLIIHCYSKLDPIQLQLIECKLSQKQRCCCCNSFFCLARPDPITEVRYAATTVDNAKATAAEIQPSGVIGYGEIVFFSSFPFAGLRFNPGLGLLSGVVRMAPGHPHRQFGNRFTHRTVQGINVTCPIRPECYYSIGQSAAFPLMSRGSSHLDCAFAMTRRFYRSECVFNVARSQYPTSV
jgi:hypothetical protein